VTITPATAALLFPDLAFVEGVKKTRKKGTCTQPAETMKRQEQLGMGSFSIGPSFFDVSALSAARITVAASSSSMQRRLLCQ